MSAGPAILVVDDGDDNRHLLAELLEREGHDDLTFAANGRDALLRLSERAFDLVLLDVMMPGLDGIQTLAAMKADPASRDIPVVMISAVRDLQRVARCIELGAEDYLPKPFNRVLLRARVGACLEKKRLRDRERVHLAELERQRARLSGLLRVILPAPAAAELEATGAVQPRRHANVAVLICDVADFTAYCDRHPPEVAVANLQHVVEAFERLAAAEGLEKLKTVGDALIATAGLHAPHEDPVMAGLRSAFALIESARHGPARWEMRCGLHVGPVVAGVVGREKFSFDLWGDTVNVAARLAALDDTGCVYLSEPAWRHVAGRCRGEPLGPVPLHGKGLQPVFRCTALARRPSA